MPQYFWDGVLGGQTALPPSYDEAPHPGPAPSRDGTCWFSADVRSPMTSHHFQASPIDAFTVWYNADPVGSGANRYWQTPSSGLLPDGRAASAFPCKNCCPCKPYNQTSGNFNQACK